MRNEGDGEGEKEREPRLAQLLELLTKMRNSKNYIALSLPLFNSIQFNSKLSYNYNGIY